jgi:SlyX protein
LRWFGYDRRMTDAERLNTLEMRIAHQDETIEDLNRIVTEQWKTIDRLTREVAMLTERVKQAEQAALTSDPGDEPPPPHW